MRTGRVNRDRSPSCQRTVEGHRPRLDKRLPMASCSGFTPLDPGNGGLMAALRYEGVVWIFVNDDLLGEGTGLLKREPNREANSSWRGDIVVRGVDELKLLGVNRIRVPSGEERHVRVNALNVADAVDSVAQAMSFDGFGTPPF